MRSACAGLTPSPSSSNVSFCAHPYVIRLLGMDEAAVDAYRREVLAGDHRGIPGAVRASAGLGTSGADIDALVAAVGELAAGVPAPVPYEQDPSTGDFFPVTDEPGWRDAAQELGAACSLGGTTGDGDHPGAGRPAELDAATAFLRAGPFEVAAQKMAERTDEISAEAALRRIRPLQKIAVEQVGEETLR